MLQRDLRTYLKKALKVSNAKLRQLLTRSAEVGYNYDLSTLSTVRARRSNRRTPHKGSYRI